MNSHFNSFRFAASQSLEQAKVPDALLHESPSEARSERAEPPWFCDWFSQNSIPNYQRLSFFCLTSRILNLDKNDVHWHVDEGRKLTGPYLSRVEIKRSALYQRVCEFFEKYDFFVLPVNQVLPFDVTRHYPTEIDGVKMDNYLSWMKSACYITTTGNPAASVPCAFSRNGLPIGIQIVGRNHDDWGVLQMAYAFEQARNLEKRRPVALN